MHSEIIFKWEKALESNPLRDSLEECLKMTICGISIFAQCPQLMQRK
jgi:hypothetical protein